ncbi:MAG: hypothetical protein Kow0098_04710 [Ignavibacteriaceae bacterium]
MQKSEKWAEDELRILKRFYASRGSEYVATKTSRNRASVMAKAAKLGIKFNRVKPWKVWEDNYLKRHYNDRRKLSIAKTLKRTVPSVIGRARLLNLTGTKADKWSDEEKEILRKFYHDRKVSLDEISRLVKRTKYAVLLQAQYLGLKRP